MTISILHSFQSGIADSAVAGLIKPSNWNAGHLLYMDQGRLVGRTTASPGVAHEIEPTGGLGMANGQLYLTDTNITPGSYAYVSLTVDAKGRITAIANGPGGGSAVLAQEWAENPEDDEVTGFPGQYSALHWAAKAEGYADDAAASAALINPSNFATAAQGSLADSAVQPGDLATVATTGAYSDLSGKPTLGTAAAAATTDFATAAQGLLADSAIQPSDLADYFDKTSDDSGDIEFTQAGTGAVARTAEDKLRERVSVLDFIPVAEHAAIFARTSTTDLTTYVQAAVDYLNSIGGGLLQYSYGRYVHGPVYIPYDNIHIRGMGVGATLLYLKDSPSSDQWAMLAVGIQSNQSTTVASDDISICDLEVDGNKANQLNGTGVSEGVNIGIGVWRCQRLTLKNLLVHDCDGYGLGLIGTEQADRSDYIIEDVETHSNNYDGIDIKGGTTNKPARLNLNRVYSHDNGPGFIASRDAVGLDLRGTYVRATNCHTWNNDDHGIRLRDTYLYDVVLHGCTGIGNGGDGFEINGATDALAFKLIGCWGIDNTGSGFDVRKGPCSLIDCYATDNAANGIFQQTTPSDLTVIGGYYARNTNDGHNCSVAGATLHVSGGAIFELNNRRGIDFDGERIVLDGAIIRNNDTGNNNAVGVLIDGNNGLSWFSITNCQIYDDDAGDQNYAIGFANSPAWGVIANNYFDGNATAVFSGTMPSGTVLRSNKGYSTPISPATSAQFDCSNLGTWYVVGRSGVQVSHTGDTNETTLATISVPAGAMGPNGILRITAIFGATGSAGTKTARVKLSSTTFSQLAMSSAQSGQKVQVEIHNRNSSSSQISHNSGGAQAGSWGLSTSAPTTGSIATSSAQDITLTGQLANGADSIAIEAYTVEVLYGA